MSYFPTLDDIILKFINNWVHNSRRVQSKFLTADQIWIKTLKFYLNYLSLLFLRWTKVTELQKSKKINLDQRETFTIYWLLIVRRRLWFSNVGDLLPSYERTPMYFILKVLSWDKTICINYSDHKIDYP